MCPEQGCNYYLEDMGAQWFETYHNEEEAASHGIEGGHHYRVSYKCPDPECGKVYYRNVVLHEAHDLS